MTSSDVLHLARRIEILELTTERKRKGIFQSPPIAGAGGVCIECNDRLLVGLDPHTLEQRWRASVRDLSPHYWWDERFLVVFGFGGVGVWDSGEGRLLWTVESGRPGKRWNDVIVTLPAQGGFELRDPLGRVVSAHAAHPAGAAASHIAVCGDLLICQGETGDGCAFRLQDGEVIWSRNLKREMADGVAEREQLPLGMACGTFGFLTWFGQDLFGWSLVDGRLRWRTKIQEKEPPVLLDGPLLYDGKIVILDWSVPRFMVVDEATGKMLADHPADRVYGMYYLRRGSVLGGKVCFVSESGHLAVFDLATGELLQVEEYKMAFEGSVAVDGRLLVTARDGCLWVFEEGPGAGRRKVPAVEKLKIPRAAVKRRKKANAAPPRRSRG